MLATPEPTCATRPGEVVPGIVPMSDWQSRLGQNNKPDGTRTVIPRRCSEREETRCRCTEMSPRSRISSSS